VLIQSYGTSAKQHGGDFADSKNLVGLL